MEKKYSEVTCYGCKFFISEGYMEEGQWRSRGCKKGHTDNARRPLPLRCEDFTTTAWHYYWYGGEEK